MKRYWRRGRELGLEQELRARRPQPRSEFVHELESRVHDDARRARGGLRVAFVGALTACMLFVLASVGGLGYAASAVEQATATAKRVVATNGPVIANRSSAADQYKPKTGKKAKKKAKKKRGAKPARRARPRFTG